MKSPRELKRLLKLVQNDDKRRQARKRKGPLKKKIITKKTRRRYTQALRLFFKRTPKSELTSIPKIDRKVAKHMQWLYAAGKPKNSGAIVTSAIQFFMPAED